MSFEQNDNNTSIHLGNYEEFFILYLDRELNVSQIRMVEDFLSCHPDLQAEFDLLMSTKLPVDVCNIDKASLMASHMNPSNVSEDLLLYLDEELPGDRKSSIELELDSEKDFNYQYQVLLQTKLDPNEIVACPRKEDLYHKREKIIFFRPWMRVAAAATIIALSGVVYFLKPTTSDQGNSIVSVPISVLVDTANKPRVATQTIASDLSAKITDAAFIPNKHPKILPRINNRQYPTVIVVFDKPGVAEDAVAADPETVLSKKASVIISKPVTQTVTAAFDPGQAEDTINNSRVTSHLSERITNDIASNDKKGSVKGFLRRATRLIEKRTGFDPTNENGELLIGMVAIQLK